MIKASFDLQITLILPIMLKSIGCLVQKFKINFLNGGPGGHLGFLIGTTLAIIDLQATPILPTKF